MQAGVGVGTGEEGEAEGGKGGGGSEEGGMRITVGRVAKVM